MSDKIPDKHAKRPPHTGFANAVVLLLWVLMPPVWFWLEYFGLYRYDPIELPEGYKKADSDSFKYGQDLSAKVWLALVTTLTILHLGKDIKG